MECFENLRVIPEEACMGQEDLTVLDLPEGVEEIGEGAFAACENLTKIRFPSTMRSIGPGAFMHCFSLQEVTIPDAVEVIGDMAFFGCASLKTVHVENQACRIGSYAFGGFFPDPKQTKELELYGASGESSLEAGHFPPRFPEEAADAEKLMYALLWCKEKEKPPHPEAEAFLSENMESAFAYILRTRRKDLLEALLGESRIPPRYFPNFVKAANEAGQPELAGLLLHSAARPQASVDFDEEFSL